MWWSEVSAVPPGLQHPFHRHGITHDPRPPEEKKEKKLGEGGLRPQTPPPPRTHKSL